MPTNLLQQIIIFQDNQEKFMDILTYFNSKIKCDRFNKFKHPRNKK